MWARRHRGRKRPRSAKVARASPLDVSRLACSSLYPSVDPRAEAWPSRVRARAKVRASCLGFSCACSGSVREALARLQRVSCRFAQLEPKGSLASALAFVYSAHARRMPVAFCIRVAPDGGGLFPRMTHTHGHDPRDARKGAPSWIACVRGFLCLLIPAPPSVRVCLKRRVRARSCVPAASWMTAQEPGGSTLNTFLSFFLSFHN